MENKKLTPEEIVKWSQAMYAGTTYSHKTKMVAYNDKYALFYKISSTEYVGRMYPQTAYSCAEWLIVEIGASEKDMYVANKNILKFYKEGRLTKADKEEIKNKFELIVPVLKVNNDHVYSEDKYIIAWRCDSHYGFSRLPEVVVVLKLTKEDDKHLHCIKDSEKSILLKKKYYFRIFDSQEEAEVASKQAMEKLKYFNEEYQKVMSLKNETLNFIKQKP